jgi:PII-like signaling protein
VSREILTLTAYFAERERTGGRFLADALLNLFSERQIASSVMRRGISSFGPTNVLRSDRSLSLSEDPPVTITAVDTPDRIGALTDDVAASTGRGLITVQRGHLATVTASGPHSESVRLSVHLGRRHRTAGAPAYVAVCEVMHRLEFAGAQAFLGVDGTAAGQRRRARFFSRNTDVPLLITGVGTAAQAAAATAEIRALLPDPLLTVDPVRVCKCDGATLADFRMPGGPFQRLTVYTAENSLHDGRTIHRALIQRLKNSEHASGATVLRGIWGFHGDHRPQGDQFFQLARRVPVSTVIIDTPQAIAATYPIVDEVTERVGLVTVEAVPAMLALHNGQRLGSLRLS